MKNDAKIITIDDREYPEMLKRIHNPPQKLYILGNIENLNTKCIAIIGSRCCSNKGIKTAEKFSLSLSKLGFTIVSGMARGIDTAAHIGCLNAKGKTIAVLGSGFENIFPRENKKLFQRIIDEGGTVVSEYSEDTVASSEKFVKRNRIVSGLSLGVLVVEAKWRSGTSITASLAKSQGRKVFCIAHDMNDNTGEGTNRLIKQGAYLVTELSDITNKFEFSKNKEILDENTLQDIPTEYEEIYKCINDGINTADDIIKKLNIGIKDLNYLLTMMELEEYIERNQGKFYIK